MGLGTRSSTTKLGEQPAEARTQRDGFKDVRSSLIARDRDGLIVADVIGAQVISAASEFDRGIRTNTLTTYD